MPLGAFAALLRRLLWGAWTQNRGRLALTVTAIALGVALACAVHLINHSAAAEFSAAVRGLAGSADLTVRGARSGFDELIYPQLARRPDVALASPVLELDAKLIAPVAGTLRIHGIDPLRALELVPGLLGDARGRLVELFLPDTVMLSLPAAQALGVGEGALLQVQSGLRSVRLRVLAVLPLNDALRQPLALMDIASAQWAFDRLGTLTRIDLRLRRGASAERALAAINAELPPGVAAAEVAIAAEQGLALSRAYRVNLDMLALVALFTGAVLVYSTQTLSVLRRRTHIALLRALGLPRRGLAAWLAIEAIALGGIGAAAGIALGIGAAQLALTRFGGDLGAGFFAGVVASLHPDAAGLAAIALCGVVASLLGGLVPAIEAARAEPAQALHSGAEPTRPSRRPQWIPAACLLAFAAVLSVLPAVGGLPLFGYLALACLLSAALMLMPAYARAVLGRVPLPAAATSRLAVQQLRAAPRYASISLAAILAALSLTVAMLVMIASFRQSLDTWLQSVLPADLYARGGSAGSAWIDPATQARMRSASAVERIAFSSFDSVRIDPRQPPVTLIARDLDPQRPEAVQWVSPPRLPADGTVPVWISEAARDLFGLEPGARLSIPVAGNVLDATVAGVWRDYVRQSGALLIPRAAYLQAGGEARANEAWIWLEPGVDPDQAAAQLRAELDLGPELELREPRLLRALSLATFDRTFAVTYALELVAVVIGLFGISVGASAQALARRRELGMLHHVGMTRRDLRRILAIEGGVVGALGALAGIAAGIVMSVILVHVINRQSFHWSMTMHIPWVPLVALALVLVLCSAVTAALSVRRSLGEDIVRAVKEDW
jgi:putative ABC transport system permease protein